MKLTLAAFGTWGDVLPTAALAVGLQEKGYGIRLVIPQDFATVVAGTGIETEFLPESMHTVMKRVSSETNPLRALAAIRDLIAPALGRVGVFLASMPDQSDALLVNTWLLGIAGRLTKSRRQPLIHLALQPRIRTREMPIATMPDLPGWFPFADLYNRASYSIAGLLRWMLYVRVFSSIPLPGSGAARLTAQRYAELVDDTPSITLVSPQLMPRPSDWAPHHRLTGFQFYDDTKWEPDPGLVDFLKADSKPIYIGFGSIHDLNPTETTRVIVEALRQINGRAVLHRGWSSLGTAGLPPSMYPLDYAPHGWLLPRVRVVVHHAGAGTTAASLRAGVPSVPVPHSGDQHFWARRLHALGAGTVPLKRSRLSVQALAERLHRAATSPDINRRAGEIGVAIRNEDGIGRAVSAIEDFL